MNIENILIIVYTLWHFNNYGPPEYLFLVYKRIYFFLQKYHEFWNNVLKPEHFEIENSITIDNENKPIIKKPVIKYEDKYLEDIRKMDKEYQFTEEEENMKLTKFNQDFDDLIIKKRLKINDCQVKIEDIAKKIIYYKNSSDSLCLINENDEDDKDFSLCLSKEDVVQKLQIELTSKEKECIEYTDELDTKDSYDKLKKDVEDSTYDFIVQEHLKRLNNSYIMENTPQGNVLLIFDLSRNSFKYYSDNTIPYRYLETVGRKYVKQFNCRPIFVDMEEELKISEEKWDKEREQLENEKKIKEEDLKNGKVTAEKKKNVFAKFKSYNKEAGTGKVNSGVPPKNSIPNQRLIEKQENEKVLLKEKANRYTYEGKMANFSFIKKVDRKVVDKKYAMSFADFKKMQKEKK